MEEKSTARKNSVKVVGYLKENLLELIKNSNGDNVIRGSIIIATSDIDSHKVQFYVSEKTRQGDTNKEYENLLTLLPENTVSIASYLKMTPTANFATAAQMSTKVWAMARFDEFATRNGERETSMILLKGYKAGFKTVTDSSPFVPGATFTCDVYIDSIEKEVDSEGSSTGRALLTGYSLMYDKSALKIDFVAPDENNVAAYILANYAKGDTVTLTGDVLSIVQTEAKENGESEAFFGRSIGERQYTTRFVRERRIYGGSKVALHAGDEGAITPDELRTGLVLRDEKIARASSNGKGGHPQGAASRVVNNADANVTPASFVDAKPAKGNLEDFDF